MPRWLRLFLTVWMFFLFFAGSPFLALVVFPLMRLFAPDRQSHQTNVTRFVHRGLRFFVRWYTAWRLIDAPHDVALPEDIDPRAPYVLIANHPTLIDVVLMLAYFEGLTSVTKGKWARSFALGPFLRQTHYLPGRGANDDEDEDVLGGMIAHVAQHPIVVFPEGTRSSPERLHRFRRGAVEVAARAQVPLLAAFIDVSQPYLTKDTSPWRVPFTTPRFRIEWLDVVRFDEESLDPKDVNRRLFEAYQARFARSLAEREKG
jgi:1-acyl-sn-glycerol-3-phosphate acyltransferase